jgi:hypothetical protein
VISSPVKRPVKVGRRRPVSAARPNRHPTYPAPTRQVGETWPHPSFPTARSPVRSFRQVATPACDGNERGREQGADCGDFLEWDVTGFVADLISQPLSHYSVFPGVPQSGRVARAATAVQAASPVGGGGSDTH